MKTPKTPLEFDYDLWTTEDGKCMVRIKATNEVTEVTREIMRLLRAEEKQMRRLHPATETDRDTATLSLDAGDPQQGPSSWLADPSDFTQDIAFDLLEATFFQQLTTIQRDVYQAVIKDGLRPYDYAKQKGISPSAVTQHIQAIRRKAKKNFFRTLLKNPLKNVRCIVKGFQSTFLLFDNGISGNLNTLADGEASGRVREDHLCGTFRIEGRPNKVQSDTHSGQGSPGKLSRHDPVSLQ